MWLVYGWYVVGMWSVWLWSVKVVGMWSVNQITCSLLPFVRNCDIGIVLNALQAASQLLEVIANMIPALTIDGKVATASYAIQNSSNPSSKAGWDIRAVYRRENNLRITQSVDYVSHELSHLYDHGLYKRLVRGLRKPRTSFLCRSYEQFAAYISRGLCNPQLVFPRINCPIVMHSSVAGKYALTCLEPGKGCRI